MKSIEFNIFKADQPKLKPIKGRVLIAEPFLPGPYFNRSIILLTECNKEGAMGFVLNKSSDLYPDEVIDDLFSFKGELYLGGPVSSDTLFFVHRLGDRVPGSVKITGDLYWGGDFEVIKDVITSYSIHYTKLYEARKEVLGGKAKFGIFGDGKEIPQIAMAKQYKKGDWRSGYYRDQTFMLASGSYNFV